MSRNSSGEITTFFALSTLIFLGVLTYLSGSPNGPLQKKVSYKSRASCSGCYVQDVDKCIPSFITTFSDTERESDGKYTRSSNATEAYNAGYCCFGSNQGVMKLSYPHFEPATTSCEPLIVPTKGPEPTPNCGPGITGQYGTVYCNKCGDTLYGQCAQLSATEWVRCVGNRIECPSYNCFQPDLSCSPSASSNPSSAAEPTSIPETNQTTPPAVVHQPTPTPVIGGLNPDGKVLPSDSFAPTSRILPTIPVEDQFAPNVTNVPLAQPTSSLRATSVPVPTFQPRSVLPTPFYTNTPYSLPEKGPNDLSYGGNISDVARNIFTVVEDRNCRRFTQLNQFVACFCAQFADSCETNTKIKSDAEFLYYRLVGGRPLQCLEYVSVVVDKISGIGFTSLPTDYSGCSTPDGLCRDKASAFVRRNNASQTIFGFNYLPASSVTTLQKGDVIVYKGPYEDGSPGHINICDSPFGNDCRVCEANKNNDGKITCTNTAQPFDAIYRKL